MLSMFELIEGSEESLKASVGITPVNFFQI